MSKALFAVALLGLLALAAAEVSSFVGNAIFQVVCKLLQQRSRGRGQ
jgi:hypothetical protein